MPISHIFCPDQKMGRLQFRIHAARLFLASALLLLTNFLFNASAGHPLTPETIRPIYNGAAILCGGSLVLMIVTYTPIITILRLRDTGLPTHLTWLLLVPGVGTLLFMTLVILPTNWRRNLDIDAHDDNNW